MTVATAQQNQAGSAWSLVARGGEDFFLLPAAAGRIKVQFDAGTVFEKPDVKYPYEIRFAVQQLIGTMGASIAAAETQPVVYR